MSTTNALTIHIPETAPPQPETAIITAPSLHPYRRFFDFEAARQAVYDHIGGLRSEKTPEKHTRRVYGPDLDRFIEFVDTHGGLPTDEVMRKYIAYLSSERGLSSATVSRYLASARHFCRFLANQPMPFDLINSTREMFMLVEIQKSIHRALDIKNPREDNPTSESALDAYGQRLSVEEVEKVLASCNQSTIEGKRDYAFFMVGFLTGRRISEIGRITLNSMTQTSPDTWKLRVRGKGSKVSPVAIDTSAVRAVQHYVEAHNKTLMPDDTRHIGPDTPVWMPIIRTSRKNPSLTRGGLHKIVKRHAEIVGIPFAAHDMRRTLASWMREADVPYDLIGEQLCHDNIDQTKEYVGKKQDFDALNIVRYGVRIGI